MDESNVGITLRSVDLEDGRKSLVFEGCALDDSLVQRSATLRGLLQLEGDAPLHIQRSAFILWGAYSEARSYTLPELADLTEVLLPSEVSLGVLKAAACPSIR